jgi:hypothetical protein
MKHLFTVLSVVVMFAMVSVTFAQDAEATPAPTDEPALSVVVETTQRNTALTTVAFIGICLVSLFALGFSAYMANAQTNAVPISDVLKLVKTTTDAVTRATLPIAFDIAKATPNKFDDAAIEAVLLASGWTVKRDDKGNLVSATPPVLPDTASVSGALKQDA